MRTASAGLITLLNSATQLAFADLYTFTLSGGQVLRYTSADRAITYSGNTWGIGPLIRRSRTKLTVGISVDSLDLSISANATVLVSSTPMMQFIAQGGLDGARCKLERVFMSDWSAAPAGSIVLFSGRVNDVTISRYEAQITVQSDLELLDANVPRNLYQPACMNTLYDGACGKNRIAMSVSGSLSGTPTRAVMATGRAEADGYFDLGVITFTTGQNSGQARTVKKYAGGVVTLITPLPFTPVAGDWFTMYPGCDKTMGTCNSKFGNLSRFRGQPFVPVPETVT